MKYDSLILRCGTDEVGTASKEGPVTTGSAALRASRLASLAPQHEGRGRLWDPW